MTGARNIKAGLVLLALSLAGGLAMSLYAFVPMIPVPAGLEHYDDVARRLLRLAHVAAVMVPLLNILLGLLLDRLRLSPAMRELTSFLLLAGALGLPLALAAEGLSPVARGCHLAGPPAIATTLGAALATIGALRTPAAQLLGRRGPEA
ncbi:MAG: hypothetical protein HY293_01350 [Planctomycetes bacterium]|nr:hypothetical protein [Planctomycetota bacterium]